MTVAIGLISGTSVDGIDAALVEISGSEFDLDANLIASATYPYPDSLRAQILAVGEGRALSLAELAELDDAIAAQFALAAQTLQSVHPPAQLIGSHGQTVFHRSPSIGMGSWGAEEQRSRGAEEQGSWRVGELGNGRVELGYTLQLGRGDAIAHLTGLPVACNFRAADIAAGGQGAPLVSKVDVCLLGHPTKDRCVQNLGGIGNFTYIPAANSDNWEHKICGWDTGPGNMLLDLAIQELTGGREQYDCDGRLAARGTPCMELVNQWLEQDFFRQIPPKSTGRESFGQTYLHQCQKDATVYQLSGADWLSTLTELTAASVAIGYRTFLPRRPDEVLLCGGGTRNLYLKQRLERWLEPAKVLTTDEVGLSSEFKEAIAFAVLGYWRLETSLPGNLPQVTGARCALPLGNIYRPIAAASQFGLQGSA
ncbi:MAG: anhydro-N-acetylmuramic acid kinase [Cyanobacteriota bacterium]|nr:anhydro-N-acetylmuramic acid kinase [Cyanobacteriota bacterium]